MTDMMTTPIAPPDPIKARQLDAWFAQIDAIFLARVSPQTGLLPASTAHTVHGDYAHAWVRDNVYSVLGIWGLAAAHRRHNHAPERAAMLEGRVVKLMRGLLTAMMNQAPKVERFKQTQDPLDGLHAKYDADTGKPVVDDDGWGHLQIDATSLFVLFLAQMSAAGLPIIENRDELDFVQNLVHYISPAYRIADYGIWERGRKSNDGVVEINASSVGIAKAALEAIDNMALLGADHPAILVPPDDIARARETLQMLLPAESASKETDAALLAVIGWPAFAVDDKVLVGHTRARILDRLAGRYGCKRFMRDGHQTAVEDEHRLHYNAGELLNFANIESEWPLFFTYLLVDAEMREDGRNSDAWAQRLEPLFQEIDGLALLPELYIVPEDRVAAETIAPGSQDRIAGANVPLLWAQSQWILGALMRDKLLDPADIDPLSRRKNLAPRAATQISFCVIAEDVVAQAKLASLGFKIESIGGALAQSDLRPAGDLVSAWTRIGANTTLGLTGRPARRLGPLATAAVYEAEGRPVVVSPTLQEAHDHHIRYDAAARARRIRGDLRYIARNWRDKASPIFILSLDHIALSGDGADRLIDLLREIESGQVDYAATKLVTLSEIFDRHSKTKPIGHVLAPRRLLPARQTLEVAAKGDYSHMLEAALASSNTDEIEAAYEAAGRAQDWRTARRAAAALKRTDPRLQDSAKDIIVRLRRLDLGAGHILTRPVNEAELVEQIREGFGDEVSAIVGQEALQALGLFSKSDSTAVRGMQTVRLREIINCVANEADGGMEAILKEPPSAVFDHVKSILLETPSVRAVVSPAPQFNLMPSANVIGSSWRQWRERLGVLTRVGSDFYARLWSLLHVCQGIVFGANNRLDAAIARSDLTAWERDFALEIEIRLETIKSPAYRALCLEALNVLANCHEGDPAFQMEGDFILDDIIHGAAALIWRLEGRGEADWTHPEPVWNLALAVNAQVMACAMMDVVRLSIRAKQSA
jgi:phosphorylase kinase alpha/beta subunit